MDSDQTIDSRSSEADSPSRRVQARGTRTRERLLVAGRDLFARGGYDGTSIGDVARRAAVGVGTVYHHFADKRTLLIALLERYETVVLEFEEEGGAFGVAFAGDDAPAAVRAMVRVAVDLRRLHPSIYPIGKELGRRDPEVEACCERIEEAHRSRIRLGIEYGQRIGRIRPEIDASAAAFLFQQLVQSTLPRIAEQPEEADIDPLVAEFSALMCRHLLP